MEEFDFPCSPLFRGPPQGGLPPADAEPDGGDISESFFEHSRDGSADYHIKLPFNEWFKSEEQAHAFWNIYSLALYGEIRPFPKERTRRSFEKSEKGVMFGAAEQDI